MFILRNFMLGAVIATTAYFLSFGASASTIDCLAVTGNAFSGESACEVSTGSKNDFTRSISSDFTVNTDEFFGFNDWNFLFKDESFSNGKSGFWNIDDGLWDQYGNIMLIFKSGKNTTLTGYLLEKNVSSGEWLSPFSSPQFDLGKITKDVSHISFYARGEPMKTPEADKKVTSDIPEPGGLALLVIGMAGLMFSRINRSTGKK